MEKNGLVEYVGADNFAPDIFKALEIARRHIGDAETGKQYESVN
jgi:hypothetical protein